MTDEQISNQLREFGCPYSMDDSRARVWLDGYEAATLQAADKLRRDLCDSLAKGLLQ